jgi:hypothetical protein
MDTAGAVDAQNAPTAPWKTAQNAVSHSPHASSSIRLTHEIPDTPSGFRVRSCFTGFVSIVRASHGNSPTQINPRRNFQLDPEP